MFISAEALRRPLSIVPARDLAHAPRALVHFATAPDGLPWLLSVDRHTQIHNLYSTVLSSFGLQQLAQLPSELRDVVGHLGAALLGVHSVELDAGPQPAYVSRADMVRLLGRSLLAQLIEPAEASHADTHSHGTPITSITPEGPTGDDAEHITALAEAFRASRSRRHLLLTLERESCWVGTVACDQRALRTPRGPYRPVLLERIADLPGAELVLARTGGPAVRIPLAEDGGLDTALSGIEATGCGGDLTFAVPRRTVLDVLIGVASLAEQLHRDGLVHADLKPDNVLLQRGEPVSFDSLGVKVGQRATAATFGWAAPEQVLARPLGPASDVYPIGKMAAELVGAVPFGEEVRYLVPTGGSDRQSVCVLKTEGVFVDITDCDHDRRWQRAWQDVLLRAMSYDPDRRIGSAAELAALLSELADTHPPAGSIPLEGSFGKVASLRCPQGKRYARVVTD